MTEQGAGRGLPGPARRGTPVLCRRRGGREHPAVGTQIACRCELQWTPGDGEGQEGLEECCPWVHDGLDITTSNNNHGHKLV